MCKTGNFFFLGIYFVLLEIEKKYKYFWVVFLVAAMRKKNMSKKNFKNKKIKKIKKKKNQIKSNKIK